MPKVKGMKFPYTRQGIEEAQKYQNAMSPEQQQMKKALETSIAGQIQAIQGGINRIQKQNMMRKILGDGFYRSRSGQASDDGFYRSRSGQASDLLHRPKRDAQGNIIKEPVSDLLHRPKRDAQGNIIPPKATPLGSYKKGGKVKKKY